MPKRQEKSKLCIIRRCVAYQHGVVCFESWRSHKIIIWLEGDSEHVGFGVETRRCVVAAPRSPDDLVGFWIVLHFNKVIPRAGQDNKNCLLLKILFLKLLKGLWSVGSRWGREQKLTENVWELGYNGRGLRRREDIRNTVSPGGRDCKGWMCSEKCSPSFQYVTPGVSGL